MPDFGASKSSIDEAQVGINGIALLSPLTGIGQYTFHLVRELQPLLQRNPWLFYGTSWGQDIRTSPLPGVDSIKKKFKQLIPHPYQVLRFFLQRNFSAGVRKHKISLYHETNFMAFRYAGPTVVTVHDLSWIRHPETQPESRVRIMNQLMPEVVSRANHILVDSEFVRQEVISHYQVPPDRISTVLLGVSSQFQPADAAACHSTLSARGLQLGRYILAVGTLEPRKNLRTVIAAYTQLPDKIRADYPLLIVGMHGWGMEIFSPSVKLMIERRQIILAGYVAQSELPHIYAGARLLVYPSLYEGFGLPPLEAMACGTPVIVSNRSSLPEVVGDAGILVDAMDDAGIAQKIQALIEDEELYRKYSLAGQQRAANFSWRKCALETLAIYRKTLDAL